MKNIYKICLFISLGFLLTMVTQINATPVSHWSHVGDGDKRASEYCLDYANSEFWTSEQNYLYRSSDGVNWGAIVLDKTTNQFAYNVIKGVKYNNGLYTAVGTRYDTSGNYVPQRIIYESKDGMKWTNVSGFQGFTSGALLDVAYGNGRYVVISDSYDIYIKKNNDAEYIRYYIGFVELNSIVYDGSRFVVCGNDGLIGTSVDGITWAFMETSQKYDLNDIIFAEGAYVIVGDKGQILRSVTAATWTLSTIPDSVKDEDYSTITYGNGVFIAGGSHETILASTDGVVWNKELYEAASTYGPDRLLTSTFANGRFLLAGYHDQYYSISPLDPPNSPSQMTVTKRTASEISFSWQDNADDETHQIIWRKEGGGDYKFLTYVDENVQSFVDKGLKSGTKYGYKIVASNNYGYSTYSTSGEGTTLTLIRIPIQEPVLLILSAPSAPTNLQGSIYIGSSLRLTWKDNATNESYYKVERHNGDAQFEQVALLGPNITEYIDFGLDVNTIYTYRVRAFNYKGDSAYSNQVSIASRSTMYKLPDHFVNEPITIPINMFDKFVDTTESNPNNTSTQVIFQLENSVYKVNGQAMTMDIEPLIKNDRTILPIRYIVEALGGTVEWDDEEKRVDMILDGTTIKVWVDQAVGTINGSNVYIDPNNHQVKPIIVPPGRTMVPLRFVAEAFGCEVDWVELSKEIMITKP